MRAETPSSLVWLLMVGVAVVGSNSLALSPILSDVAADLGATPVAVARANAAYGGATALSALLLGRLVDRHGPGRALVAGLATLCVAMLASAGATHWAALAAAQALAGVAAGIVLPATYALAVAAAPEGRSAETLGRVLTGWAVSMVAGVPISAAIAGAASWRASYLLFAALLAGAAVLAARAPMPPAGRAPALSPAAVLRLPGVPALLAVCLLFMTAFYGTYAYLGDHLRTALAIGPGPAGLVVLAYGAGFGLGALADGSVDRWGGARLFPAVLAAVAGIYGLMIGAVTSLPAALAIAALWGFVQHLALTILVVQLGRVAGEARGAVLALNSAVTYAGALLGAWLFGFLYGGLGFPATAGGSAACAAAAALVAGPRPGVPPRAEGEPGTDGWMSRPTPPSVCGEK